MYYSFLGTIIAIIFGIVISVCTGGQIEPVDEKLLTPAVRSYYKQSPKITLFSYHRCPTKIMSNNAEEMKEFKKEDNP